ncbi:MAG: ribbon-helix-helix domain-containing protein [Rickettsiales bacterium]|nr:ribbon-helix-helix domain-containing protein [Rickettsiales bacterium]
MKKLSVNISGHQTSISIEPEFMATLQILARRRGESVAKIIHDIDMVRAPNTNLSSAVRIWVLQQMKL